MARIELENVSKVFGGHAALEDLDLDIADGEFFVLLGPTGAGKTTTLRLIAGLETPTVGHIRINGAEVNDWSPSQRDVALVLQQYSLYPRLTVRENLSFPLRSKVRNASPSEIAGRVAYAARTLRIEHPEMLLYAPMPDGKQRLVAVEYVVPFRLRPRLPQAFTWALWLNCLPCSLACRTLWHRCRAMPHWTLELKTQKLS